MFKKSLSLGLASSIILASCATPNISAEFGGIGQNPCLDTYWATSKYCNNGVTTIVRSVENRLQLADIPKAFLNTGLALPLQASALFEGLGTVPEGAQVEFFVDGKSVGKVSTSDISKLTDAYHFLLDNLSAGQHSAQAVLIGPDGSILATSNTITFELLKAIAPNASFGSPVIALASPLAILPAPQGSKIPLTAVVGLPQGIENVSVEFEFNGQRVKATQNPDGSYSFDIDTTGLTPGTYPVTAILKDGSGNEIARSIAKEIVIKASAADLNVPTLSLLNSSGNSTFPAGEKLPLSGELNIPPSLRKSGQKIEIYANGQLIGKGVVTKEGHYIMDWNTTGLPAGEYTLESKVINPDGSELVTSNLVKITLQGADVVGVNRADLVGQTSLVLEDVPIEIQKKGLKVPLQANALLSNANALPAGSEVEFFVDGVSVGKVPANELNSLTENFLKAVEGIAPGQHKAVAKIIGPTGQEIATSNEITFTLPATQNTAAVALLGPASQAPVIAGTRVPAIADARIPVNVTNGSVIFEFNGQKVPATKNPDGTYGFALDTTGLAPGTYPVTAVLLDGNGNEIGVSTAKEIIVQAPEVAATPQLVLINLAGKNTVVRGEKLPLSGQLNLPDSLKKAGQTIEFYANGQLVGTGTVSNSGHYKVDWDTNAFAPGTYPLTAKVLNNDGSQVIESNTLNVTLQGAEVSNPVIQLGSVPAQAVPGSTIPLTASPTLPAGVNSNNVTVEFKANGQTIGTGIRNLDGSYSINWNTGGQPEGNYDIQAILKDSNGQDLAISELGKVNLSNATAADVKLTSGNVSTVPGSRVTLQATAQIPANEAANGAYVEFRQGGQVIGRGTKQADGTYLINFDTTGRNPGVYPVEAVLLKGDGSQLAISNTGTVTLTGAPQSSIVLTSDNVTSSVGSTVPLTADATIASSVPNAAVQFFGGPNGAELLGNGVKQSDGSFRFDWDTTGRTTGQYPVKAVVVDANNNNVAESALGQVTLQSADQASIILSSPTNGSSYIQGSNIPLEATLSATPAQKAAGVTVEFVANGIVIGTGVDAGSDKYTTTFSQPSVGDYPVRAILKSSTGVVLAESMIHNARVTSTNTNSGGGNGSPGAVNPTAQITNAVDLTGPADGSNLVLGVAIALDANATLSAEQVASGYKLRFSDPVSNFTQDVVPTRPDTNSTNYSASVSFTPSGALGDRPVKVEVIDGNGNVVQALSDTHTITVINTTASITSPADNSVVALSSSLPLTGTVDNVPENGSVIFVVKDRNGNILQTLPASSAGGNTYTSDANWITPATDQVVAIELQVFPPGTSNPVATDSHEVRVTNATVNLVTPLNNATAVVGSDLTSTATATNVPAGGKVTFVIKDANGNIVKTSDDANLADNDFSAVNSTTGLNLQTNYQVVAQVKDSSGDLLLESNVHQVSFTPAGTLDTPPENALFYTDKGPVTLKFTPKDANGTALTLAQLNGATVDFVDLDGASAAAGDTLGAGLRQADGSYTFNWVTSGETLGQHQMTGRLRNSAGNANLLTDSHTIHLQPYDRTVFIVDTVPKKIYYAYTGVSTASANGPVIPDNNTGNRTEIFNTSFKTSALAKHPTSGDFYYIEVKTGNDVKFARYNPSTKTETIIASNLNVPANIIRLAFDPVSKRLYAGTGTNIIYEVDLNTGALTTLSINHLNATEQNLYARIGNGGDLAITQDGYMYLVAGDDLYAFRLDAANQALEDGFYVGRISIPGGGGTTSLGLDGDIDAQTGQVQSVLLLSVNGRHLRYPLNVTGANNRRLGNYDPNDTNQRTTASSTLATYGDHETGDMSAAHTGN